MGFRLSKIYTRTGDDGTTGLGDGTRVPKHSTRIATLGAIDELNSQLGVLLAESDLPATMHAMLTRIQHELFELGGELSIPNYTRITPEMVTRLEQELDALNDQLAPLKEFILPGGSRAAALCHVARAVCRRAECQLAALAQQATVSAAALMYINRLSDLLFVLCRSLNRALNVPDVLWAPRS